MKTAIVADWLPTLGGAERVICAFHDVWSEAPIFTTVAKKGHLGKLDEADIHTSYLQLLFELTKKHQPLLPWMPKVIETFDLEEYDIVISSSHAVAKAAIVQPSAVHICYCHTPMRYAWEMENEYINDFNIPKKIQPYVRRLLRHLRRWDLTTTKRVDYFIANSSTVQERIKRIYNRDSVVIHPPVDDVFFTEELAVPDKKKPFLAFGRLVPYKRFDLLIQAANTYKFPLVIAGTGQDEQRLKEMAGPTVQFKGYIASEELGNLYRSTRALLYPQFEDAGVVPLEAQACGLPVIAYKKGGALDTIKEKETGLFFEKQTTESLHACIEEFTHWKYDPANLRKHAEHFKEEHFKQRMLDFVTDKTR